MINSLVSSLPPIGGSGPVQTQTATATPTATSAPGEDFGSMMARMTNDAIDGLKSAESVSVAGIKGKASAQQVVESVMAAEESLQTAIAIRDKVVSAYMEISRMTI